MTIAVDLFAGGGGFTEGAEQAGVRVPELRLWPEGIPQTAADLGDGT